MFRTWFEQESAGAMHNIHCGAISIQVELSQKSRRAGELTVGQSVLQRVDTVEHNETWKGDQLEHDSAAGSSVGAAIETWGSGIISFRIIGLYSRVLMERTGSEEGGHRLGCEAMG